MNHFALPDFKYEKKLWKRRYGIVAGLDEVGRGSFAGPVVAAACAFAPASSRGSSTLLGPELPKDSASAVGTRQSRRDSMIIINDSKKLNPRQREIAANWIIKNSLTWGIGEASVGLINRIGIGKATATAFRKAISDANVRLKTQDLKQIDYLLIDAFYVPYVRGLRRKNQKPIINGDEKSISIAAASIIAKVYRDKLMASLGQKPKYKKYNWEKNKGYGTLEHREAIKKYGITKLHRKVFVKRSCENIMG